MATYTTSFSFTVPVADPTAAVTALQEAIEDFDEDEGAQEIFGEDASPSGLGLRADADGVWITDEGGEGNIHAAIAAVDYLLGLPGSPDEVVFDWADGCSRPLEDAYGGGTVRITPTSTRMLHTSNVWPLVSVIDQVRANLADSDQDNLVELLDGALRVAGLGLTTAEEAP